MSDTTTRLVVNITSGAHDDRSTVGFTVANAARSQGKDVAVFLSSDAVDLSRAGACEYTQIQPFKPLAELIESFAAAGGIIWACSPCFKHRGLNEAETVPGTTVTGAGPMLEWIDLGAQIISY